MNNDLHSATRSTAIRDLNDRFRRSLTGGTLMLTAGVIEMGAEAQDRIIKAVQAFVCVFRRSRTLNPIEAG